MAIDESFKKPGAIPFKWEIKPGLPKHHQSPPPEPLLRPPPAIEPRVDSLRSDRRSRSDRWVHRSETVSVGCFQGSPLLKRIPSVKCAKKSREVSYFLRNDDVSEFETQARLSVSSRKSIFSPFRDSTASFCSSPDRGHVSDAEWAAFGLF